MRIAFISDPHGDLVALHKVIADLKCVAPVDEVLLGGDLAQGGAQPAEVVDEIRNRGWRSVRGNSDDFLVRIADGHPEAGLTEQVASRGAWTVGKLGAERVEYLRSLPLAIKLGPFHIGAVALVHATPWRTRTWFFLTPAPKFLNGWFERPTRDWWPTATSTRRTSGGLAMPPC